MTAPSGTADEILQLPSGGGSVSGAGDSFSIDLNTGTLTAAIELQVPAGPNAVAPQLSLRYSSAAGDGPFGRGWSLPTLSVVKNPAGGYTLSGVGELLEIGGGRWRPAVDTTGQLITFDGTTWSAIDYQDTRFTLGSMATSRIGNPTMSWLLDTCTDSSGNAVTYTWQADSGWPVPASVSWGTYQLRFTYQARPDTLLSGAYGVPVRLGQRCSAIELHVLTEEATLVRSWQLGYEDADGAGRTLLASVVEQGHSADGSVLPAPARQFTYTTVAAPELLPVTGFVTPLDDPDTDLVDLNGDGLPDLLHLGAGWPTVGTNRGDGSFGFPRPLTHVPAPIRLSSANVAFADMSGGGNADLLVLERPLAGYYPLEAPGGTAPSGFGLPVVFRQAPSVLPGDPRVRFLDLNGDGITDLLFDTGRAWLGWLRTADNAWDATPMIVPPERTPPVSLTDAHVYLADMTGDGWTDIVLVTGGGVTYWPGRADGGWGEAVVMNGGPQPDRMWEPERLAVYDVDGDGCADLVYVGPLSTTVWLTTGADRLGEPMIIAHTPLATPGSYRIADLFGRGTAGVHFQLPATRGGEVRQCFLDLTGGAKPGLLQVMANGPAKTTTVTWTTSTAESEADRAAGMPWPTYHPFPVQCVGRTDDVDHGSGLTATVQYHYHDGRYDPGQRAFLGFGRVDTVQPGDDSIPTLRTETVFHLGLDPADPARPLTPSEAVQFGALRRKVLQTTVWGQDGSAAQSQPYSVTTSSYDAHLLPAADGQQVAVPYTVATTEQRWERQASPWSTRLVQFLGVDDDGNITEQRTTASRAGVATADQDVVTTTTYATGGTNLHLPARVTQTLPDGTLVGASVTYYDGPDYIGLPEGQASLGHQSRIEDLAFTDDFVTTTFGAAPPDLTPYGYHRLAGDATGWWITRRAHARGSTATGPTLTTKGPLGATQTAQLDAAGQRTVAITDAMGNTITATYDPRVVQAASITDQNGVTCTDVFDALGRVTATLHAGDTTELPWATFTYEAGAQSVATAESRIEHGQPATLTSITYLDGLGTLLGKATPSAAVGGWTITDSVVRNVRGLPALSPLPYPVTSTVWQPVPAGTPGVSYTYDALGRSVQRTRPDGLVVRVRRAGSVLITSEQWPGGLETDVERQTYDAAGQLIAVERWAGDHWVEQAYAYLPSGRAGTISLPGGAVTQIGYDLLGRRWSYETADSGRTVYLLDAGHNERLRTLPTGQQVRTEVDASNRVTGVFHDGEPTPSIAYSYYDQGGTQPDDGVTAFRAGRLWKVVDELGSVTLEYEDSGRITRFNRLVAATGVSFSESYAYDALGRTVSTTLPATTVAGQGRTVDYGFGPDGRLVSASGVITSAAYDLFGRPTALDYANGTQTLIDYRPDGGALSRVRVLDSSSAIIRDVTVQITDAFVTGVTSAAAGDDGVTFTYDGLRRLASASYTVGDDHTWSYDDAFTMTTCSDAGAVSYVPGRHQMSSAGGVAVTYDAAGRMTAGRAGQLTFDASDNLSQVTTPQGHVVAHTYGFDGLRARTVVDGTESYLAPTPNLVVQGGSTAAWITFGPIRLAAEVDGALWFLHADALGGVDLVTDTNGHDAGRQRLTPYGLVRPAPGSAAAPLAVLLVAPDVTGLVCQGHRWYDPVLGQFVSPDPFVSGIFTVGAWNPYLYCLGNPVSFSDPLGCNFWDVLETIGIVVLAAACVVAAIWTGGATLVALGVLTSNVSAGMLLGAGIGALGGAISGEIAAQKAGGNIWAGAFVGAILGGCSSLAGGLIGSAVGGALNLSAGVQWFVTGAVQGAIAGFGTGLATGFAGGKGSVEGMLTAAAQGAAWGATLGGLLAVGAFGLLNTVPDGQTAYLQFGNGLSKLDPDPAVQGSLKDVVGTFSNDAGLGNDAAELASNFNVQNNGALAFDFVGVQSYSGPPAVSFLSNGALINLPLFWIPSAAFEWGAFAAAIPVSMAADQLGYSYADQVFMLSKAAPWGIDYLITMFQETNVSASYTWLTDHGNQLFGSANPNEVPS